MPNCEGKNSLTAPWFPAATSFCTTPMALAPVDAACAAFAPVMFTSVFAVIAEAKAKLRIPLSFWVAIDLFD
jgi:hypothetical protein